MVMSERELLALPEMEWETEWAAAGEMEAEEFFGSLANLAKKAVASPALRKIASGAAKSALGGLGPAGSILGGLLGEGEIEGEIEGEWEYEANPIRRWYPDAEALMEHLGHAAAEAESEEEAEAFIGALIPLAAQLVPKIAPVVMRAAPHLIKAASNVGRRLFNSPSVRPMIRAMPNIVRRTAADLSRQVASGRPVSTQTAVRTFARNTARVLGSPQQAVTAYRRSRAADHRYHRTGGTAIAPAPATAGITAAPAFDPGAYVANPCTC